MVTGDEETAVPASTPVSFSQARGRGALGWLKRLGEAAERLDLEELAEQGLGLLLDDVLGPAEGGGEVGRARQVKPAPDPPRVTVATSTPPSTTTVPRRAWKPGDGCFPPPTDGPAPVCVAVGHEHMLPHRARLPGCVRGPA